MGVEGLFRCIVFNVAPVTQERVVLLALVTTTACEPDGPRLASVGLAGVRFRSLRRNLIRS